jgi:hypothetical protein
MMAKPTKFNNMESGATSTPPSALTGEEVNRVINARSLRDSASKFDSADFLSNSPYSCEKPPETAPLKEAKS